MSPSCSRTSSGRSSSRVGLGIFFCRSGSELFLLSSLIKTTTKSESLEGLGDQCCFFSVKVSRRRNDISVSSEFPEIVITHAFLYRFQIIKRMLTPAVQEVARKSSSKLKRSNETGHWWTTNSWFQLLHLYVFFHLKKNKYQMSCLDGGRRGNGKK